MTSFKVACIIPTRNGRALLERLLISLSTQTAEFTTFIIDSDSSDGTREVAEKFTPNVKKIKAKNFNHGGTRQSVVNENPGFDIYIFLTQDTFLASSDAIEKILEPFENPVVGAVCGRQLPHADASIFAKHARYFNYPEADDLKFKVDIARLGIKAAFLSNSFAAYRGAALESVGGFPSDVIFAEDMYVAAKMILIGWGIFYAGTATCFHSHNYTLNEEFRRYFDMGVFHARETWIANTFGDAGGEGARFVKSELAFTKENIFYWPECIVRNAVKLIGFKLGQNEAILPFAVKKNIGMYKGYWKR
ncbi:rhamnosyltransferase [Robbsia andropogonis]|uniref:Rhamnosyltransferase n=1 Tax=Robbsia andropogonis TaxID=28092 RepID=A0A0F5JVQ3_9BURK|nr:glycosyltransferase [Robbsia andropogonis]KKB61943.1 rhamnosyltransferase [Robbsia andropogonis]